VRLMDGPSRREGRLELIRDGEYSTVCDNGDSRFENAEAQVACHMLGFG